MFWCHMGARDIEKIESCNLDAFQGDSNMIHRIFVVCYDFTSSISLHRNGATSMQYQYFFVHR